MPNKIIKDGQIQEDNWQLISKETAETSGPLPSGNIIVPLSLWQAQAEQLAQHDGEVSIWLDSDEGPELIAGDLGHFPLIAINFPAFTDGRGYSYARLLRERFAYEGELRAIGDVMQDQLQYMQRCGFTSFAIKDGKDIEAALKNLHPIKEAYQAATDTVPLYRRRH